jgi:hypothetical protein
LTPVDRSELRRQVAMLINHSYALGYAAGSGLGLMTRIRLRLSRARRGAGQDIRLALNAIRERLTLLFNDHEPRSRSHSHSHSHSHKMLAPAFVIPYPMRGSMAGVMISAGNRPAGLLVPAPDSLPRNPISRPRPVSPGQSLQNARESAMPKPRVTRDLGHAATIPRHPHRSEAA